MKQQYFLNLTISIKFSQPANNSVMNVGVWVCMCVHVCAAAHAVKHKPKWLGSNGAIMISCNAKVDGAVHGPGVGEIAKLGVQ